MKFAKLSLLVILLATAAVASTPATDLWIAAVANTPGAFGTQWSSDVRIYNPNTSDVVVSMTYNVMVALGGGSQSETYTVPAMSTVDIPNVLDNVFGLSNTAGSLHLTAPMNILAESRTFTPGSTGTFGQSIPGIPASQAMVAGDSSDLLYIDNSTDFRTNVGLVDVSGAGSVATLQAYAPDGTAAGAPYSVTLAANEPRQLNGVLAVMGVGSGSNYRINLMVTSGNVIPYASQVDNASGDPIYVDGTVIKAGGGPAGCMDGYLNGSNDNWDSAFATDNGNYGIMSVMLQSGTITEFPDFASFYTGTKYVWPFPNAGPMTLDTPLVLAANVPFELTSTITWVDSNQSECIEQDITIDGSWDGCSFFSGTITMISKYLSTCKTSDFKDAQGKFYFKWQAGISAGSASAKTRPAASFTPIQKTTLR